MAFSPQPSSEDLLLGSDQNPQYNNAVPHDETMCYGTDEEHSSGDELVVGDQELDYSQLERVIAGPERRSGGRLPTSRTRASQPTNFGSHRGRIRLVNGVRLFTAPLECTTTAQRFSAPEHRIRGAAVPTAPACTAVPESTEDITAVGLQAPASAFRPVMQASSTHIAPPVAESQPQARRPRMPHRTGKWTNTHLRDALAAVDGGMSMKKASDLYHIPYTSFREWCYGMRCSRKRGPPAVLSESEEKLLVDYCIRMCEMGQGLTPTALKLKVYDITKDRVTPFRDGIPGGGWMRWWRHRHPELTLRVSQALETARARGLCAENVESFYKNLQTLLTLHEYSADRIWNCDESGAQAGRSGGGVVIARKGARHVHSLVPDQREWLSVLVCINASGVSIPSFYVFKGTRFRQNYIERCEPGATMAMQPRAWMTTYLFSAWLSHFIESVHSMGGISVERRHLMILDGHNSHCTLDVVLEARAAGLDMLTLPAHTSHALQPLDVSVFKSFKKNFRSYRDFWTSRNLLQPATKSTLAHWVHLALRKALTKENICSGFRATGIYPLNTAAVNSYLGPADIFEASEAAAAALDLQVDEELPEPAGNDDPNVRKLIRVVRSHIIIFRFLYMRIMK